MIASRRYATCSNCGEKIVLKKPRVLLFLLDVILLPISIIGGLFILSYSWLFAVSLVLVIGVGSQLLWALLADLEIKGT